MPHHGRDPRYALPEPAPGPSKADRRRQLESAPPLQMDYMRELWVRYRHHNEVRPLIREILRLQLKLRIVADLQDDAYRALGRPEGEIRSVIALLRIALQNEPGLVDRVPGEARTEWMRQFQPPRD